VSKSKSKTNSPSPQAPTQLRRLVHFPAPIERHYTVPEIQRLFFPARAVSTVYRWFSRLPGVLVQSTAEPLPRRRRYSCIDVPESVLVRFLNKHKNKKE
jgi:hypothetical protein